MIGLNSDPEDEDDIFPWTSDDSELNDITTQETELVTKFLKFC
jgi:hypothetical protein